MQLVINIKTAKAIGLAAPVGILNKGRRSGPPSSARNVSTNSCARFASWF